MPRFLVGITHRAYRHRVFAVAGVTTALFLILLAVLPALFASDSKLSNAVPAYSEVCPERSWMRSSIRALSRCLSPQLYFSIWGVRFIFRCLDYVCAAALCITIRPGDQKSFSRRIVAPFYATVLWYLYYVPMTLIPLLYQLCGLRLAGPGATPPGSPLLRCALDCGHPAYRICAHQRFSPAGLPL